MNKFKISNLKLKNILLALSSLYILLFIFYARPAHAQLSSVGFATYLPIKSSKIEDGDIITSSDKGYVLTTVAYDARIIGVVTLNPSISFRASSDKNGTPVLNSGTAFVKVTGLNGNIKKGDPITSSTTPGTGMKAVDNGFVLGNALENIKFAKKTDVQEVETSVSPHFVQLTQTSSIFDLFNLKKAASSEKPSKLIQYIVAAFIMIASFACGFLIFAKAVNTGLEALGRNPLAGRMIQLGIVFNVVLIIVIIVAGTALAYLVVRL